MESSKPDERQCVATLKDADWVNSVTALPDGRLASCSHDKTVKVWDLNKPDEQQCVATLNGHNHWMTSVTALTMGGGTGSADHTVKMWDLSKPTAAMRGNTGRAYRLCSSVAALADGGWLQFLVISRESMGS